MAYALAALATRFAVMATASFLAIIVWSRKRDLAWMLIVIGIIAGYADILYSLLVEFGFLPDPGSSTGALAALGIVFPNLPWLFFSAAFISILSSRRSRP